MPWIARLLPVAALMAVGIGCGAGHVAFTPALAEQLSDEELKSVQFYVSGKIVLHRDVSSSGKSVTPRGKILLENGVQIEEVLITKGSPGVFVDQDKGRSISVSFEPPVEKVESFLKFHAENRASPYYLITQIQRYGPEQFNVQSGLKKAYVEVDADRLDSINASRRTAPGRVVGGPN